MFRALLSDKDEDGASRAALSLVGQLQAAGWV